MWRGPCLNAVVETETATAPASPTLVYRIDDRLRPAAAWLVGGQHVAAMVVGTITPPLILAGVLKFNPAETAYLVSMALMCSALGTCLQTVRMGPIGSGLLSVTGTSFSFLQPLIHAGQAGGLPLMFGLSLATAPVQLALAPFLPRLRAVFTPLVSGIVVLLIGLSLIPSAMLGIVAPLAPDAPSWAGAAVALAVIAVVIAAQAVARPWARLIGVLLGLAAGYGICGAAGWLHAPPAAEDAPWLRWPRFLPHGLAFRWDLALPFAFIYLVSLLEAMGDMTATAQLSGLETSGAEHSRRLRGGVLADGLTSLLSALVGGFPSTTYAQNNGVIQITGVASRRVGPVIAVMLAALGLFPAFGRWVTAMPPPVLGALALLLFGLVAVSGLRLIAATKVSQRDALIIALSLGVGLGVPAKPEWVASLPRALAAFFESGISAGGLTALLLGQLIPASRVEKVAPPDEFG